MMIPNIRLNIDFTKLAKIADSSGKKTIANFLIGFEKSIVKKIPFLLEVKQYEKALGFAVEGGDPNIINKVISEIMRTSDKQVTISMLSSVPDGLRHLRNYARSRKNDDLMAEISVFGMRPSDYYPVINNLKMAYAAESQSGRVDQLKNAQMKLDKIYKDEFYSKLMLEQIEVFDKQKYIFVKTRDPSVMDSSLNDLITTMLIHPAMQSKERDKEVKDFKNVLKLNEKNYFMVVIKAFAKNGNWEDVA